MERLIYLPELLSINIKNFTLYPNGLDYSYDFVKGINLIIGGNGMGKTTFVNIIKYAILGLYKGKYDLSRTYQGRPILKRQMYYENYFSNRMDYTIQVDGIPTVSLKMRINGNIIDVTRTLDNVSLIELKINGQNEQGEIIDQMKYEKLSDNEKKKTLLYRYEEIIREKTNLDFDDLIFFVNDILFFGENHKTILWKGDDADLDVQDELFNKYFNDPELDRQRQEAQRKWKYFDSLSRHRSEDMRAINKVLKSMNSTQEKGSSNVSKEEKLLKIIELRNLDDASVNKIKSIQEERNIRTHEVSLLQNEMNALTMKADELDRNYQELEEKMSSRIWERLNPYYNLFMQNIQMNHVCPICNQKNEELFLRVEKNVRTCFACGNKIKVKNESESHSKYELVRQQRKELYQSINAKKKKIHEIDVQIAQLDAEFTKADIERRKVQMSLRELEYEKSLEIRDENSIQPFYDEIERLKSEKEEYQRKSEQQKALAENISSQIEATITENVHRFSEIFSSFAGKFLGVSCSLTYERPSGSNIKRFYPVIDGKPRYSDEEMSESQRFFIDHSFRMSILTFFYTTPAFYIVETPDSSLDISYESNAAEVFVEFLKNPNSVIITSNLNNSLFVNHLLEEKETTVSMVGLLDIAKQSIIQNTSMN